MQPTILNYSPGQLVSCFLQTLNSAGIRADGYALPVADRIIFHNHSVADGYPKNFEKLGVSFHRLQFTLPNGAAAIGSYILDYTYFDPDTAQPKQGFIQVQVSSPMGKYSATP